MNNPQVKLTVLVDNTPSDNGLPGEHDFSCCVECGSNCILFDTGQTSLVQRNAAELGVDLRGVDSIVLSHGYYDHTGGLRTLLDEGVGINLFANPKAFRPKYARDKDGKTRFIGMPIALSDVRKQISLVWTHHPTEITAEIYVTGPIPRTTRFEDTEGAFFTDDACQNPDLLPDDQALFWESSKGVVILLGCAHAGVINTLNYVRQLTANKPVYAIVGGMHLVNASQLRLQATLETFKEYNVKFIAPTHCTGAAAVDWFRTYLPDRFSEVRVGTVFYF